MNNINPLEIQKAFDTIPATLKAAIDATDIAKTIAIIGNDYHLHVDAIGNIDTLALMVCLGLLPAKDFVTEVQKAAPTLSTQQLIELIQKINTQVFEPIRTYEQKIEEERKEAEAFEQLARRYEDTEPQAAGERKTSKEFTSPTPVQPSQASAITLSEIQSKVTNTTEQKTTIGEWKASGVVKSETQKTTVHNYSDKPDPYREV